MFFEYINETQTVVLFHLYTKEAYFVQLHYHEKDGEEFRNMFTNLTQSEPSSVRSEFFNTLWQDLQKRGVPDYMHDRLYRWFIDTLILDPIQNE
jgi:hypothetical protein